MPAMTNKTISNRRYHNIIRNSPSVFLCLALAYMPLTLTHTTPSETTMPGTMGTGGTTGDTGAGAVGATTEAELR